MQTMYLSGILLLLAVLTGVSEALVCVSCTWDASMPGSVNSSYGCLSQAYDEGNQTCPEQQNMDATCETIIEYNVVGSLTTIKKVNRKCNFDHPGCNNHCNPKDKPACYLCCSAANLCNSLPTSLSPMKSSNPSNAAVAMAASMAWKILVPLFVFRTQLLV